MDAIQTHTILLIKQKIVVNNHFMQYLFPVTVLVMSICLQHSNIFIHRASSATAWTQIHSSLGISTLIVPSILGSSSNLLDSCFSRLAVCLCLLHLAHTDYDAVY